MFWYYGSVRGDLRLFSWSLALIGWPHACRDVTPGMDVTEQSVSVLVFRPRSGGTGNAVLCALPYRAPLGPTLGHTPAAPQPRSHAHAHGHGDTHAFPLAHDSSLPWWSNIRRILSIWTPPEIATETWKTGIAHGPCHRAARANTHGARAREGCENGGQWPNGETDKWDPLPPPPRKKRETPITRPSHPLR